MTMSLEQTINTEPLLTIMGIVAAAWAIIPRTRLLQISLNLSWIDWALTCFALLLANYLTFEPLLSSFNLYYSIGPWLPGLDSASATYLIFLAWLTYACLRSRFGRLPRSNTKKLKELVDRLIATRQYDEIALVIEPHIERLVYIEKHRSLIDQAFTRLSKFAITAPKNPSESTLKSNKPQTTVQSTIHNITNNHGLTTHLSLTHPNICLSLIKTPSIIRTNFSKIFVDAIIKNKDSQLYMELKNNKELENPIGSTRLKIHKTNTIIQELLAEPVFSIEHCNIGSALWETTFYIIEHDKDLIKRLNTPSEYYENKDEDTCPINASISMFSIMIHEGIHNGYQNHMNIDFFLHLTKSLLEHIDIDGKQNNKQKTPIEFLIERIIATTMNLVIEGAYIDEQKAKLRHEESINKNAVVKSLRQGNIMEDIVQFYTDSYVNKEFDPIFIPKQSAIILGNIMRTIITSTKVSNEWKKPYLSQVVTKHRDVQKISKFSKENTQHKERQLADLMLDQIVNVDYPPPEYRRQLLTHVERLDKEDSKPLRDRLLKAIAEDEARESSH